jgi:hypothetical protein
MPDPNYLTKLERSVINTLATAWSLYLNLPQEHPDDQTEFRRAIHAAQNLVLARPGRRQFNTHPKERPNDPT